MEESEIESGWVYEQTSILKRMCPRWVTLSLSGLTSFKQKGDAEGTHLATLTDIEAVEKKERRKEFFCFQVVTKHRELLFFSENETMVDQWVQSICSALNKLFKFQTPSTAQSLLSSQYTQLRAILLSREQELLKLNESAYLVLQNQASLQNQLINDTLHQLQHQYDLFLQKLKELPPHTVHTLLKAPNEPLPSAPKKTVFQCNTQGLKLLLQTQTKIAAVNPFEDRVCRTQITRALKWRYSGDKVDALTISVSRDIQLTGVGICRPYLPGGCTFIRTFMVLKGCKTSGEPIYTHSRAECIPFEDFSSVYTVQMTPLFLQKNHSYTLYFILEGSPTFKCVDCTSYLLKDQVTWEFSPTVFTSDHASNRSDALCGPIADFSYMLFK